MTFCKGFKVTDVKALDTAKLDREAIMKLVTESFAYQVTKMKNPSFHATCPCVFLNT